MFRVLFAALTLIAVLIAAPSPLHALQQHSMAVRATFDAQDHGVIEPDSLDRATFSSVAELLQGRVPGLSVTRRGDGSIRLHLRGPTSVFAGNAPLVIIDGVRISLARSHLEEFEGRPGPLDDIDVEQIERIEILSGPGVAGSSAPGPRTASSGSAPARRMRRRCAGGSSPRPVRSTSRSPIPPASHGRE